MRWHQCYCSCHTDRNIMHIVACCDGECRHCGRYIRNMKEHLKEEHAKLDNFPQRGKLLEEE